MQQNHKRSWRLKNVSLLLLLLTIFIFAWGRPAASRSHDHKAERLEMKSCTATRDENNAGGAEARWASRLRIQLAGTWSWLIKLNCCFQNWYTVTGGWKRKKKHASPCQIFKKRTVIAAVAKQRLWRRRRLAGFVSTRVCFAPAGPSTKAEE